MQLCSPLAKSISYYSRRSHTSNLQFITAYDQDNAVMLKPFWLLNERLINRLALWNYKQCTKYIFVSFEIRNLNCSKDCFSWGIVFHKWSENMFIHVYAWASRFNIKYYVFSPFSYNMLLSSDEFKTTFTASGSTEIHTNLYYKLQIQRCNNLECQKDYCSYKYVSY